MQTITLTIAGIHCAGCTRTIDHLLRRQPGVWEVEVSLDEGRARVLFDPSQVTAEQLAGSIGQAGYRVTDRSGD